MQRLALKFCFLICFLLQLYYNAFSQELITQRQITLLEKARRPYDPWPRGDGHILLGEPGSPLMQKGYLEPGGSFTPSPGSFGMAIWVMNNDGTLKTTSDDMLIKEISQQYIFAGNNKIPSVYTKTPYYNCTWTYNAAGKWTFSVTNIKADVQQLILVFRSVGPAGGPVKSVIWDQQKLMLNHTWIIQPGSLPVAVSTGDETKDTLLLKKDAHEAVISPTGWGFAKLYLDQSVIRLTVTDTRPQFESALSYSTTIPQFGFSVPDTLFEQSLKAQVSNLMMGYIGAQTGPGEPINYPLTWERDGAYSLVAMAKSGQLQTARQLSVYFAENDFFGGFGSEGDAPGSAINAITEVAFLLNDSSYFSWIWPHVQRKLAIIDEMMNAKQDVYKNFLGPLKPGMETDIKRRQLICRKTENGLIVGTMDGHFPVLYINAISYRGLIQASRLALQLQHPDIAADCISKAQRLQKAWMENFGKKQYDNERNFMISIYPSWITNKTYQPFTDKIAAERNLAWNENGIPNARPLWTYFTAAEAHQWLFLDRPDLTWQTLHYFWNNQCSPGLFSYWEGDGEENSFRLWENYRGWLQPKYVTPHYWTASEMTLLQLEMLTYIDESKTEFEFVIGGGVPDSWLKEKISVTGYRTKAGTVSWQYNNNQNTLLITITGAIKKYNVRPGVAFLHQHSKIKVSYK
ncbi:MAG: hypothetical protein ABJB86_17520 [Bacteroidota bacterium]